MHNLSGLCIILFVYISIITNKTLIEIKWQF